MSVNAVQGALRIMLDGLPMPTVFSYPIPKLVAILGPPTVGLPTGPEVYIRASGWKEERESGTPGAGTKRITYQLDLTVRWVIVTGVLGGDTASDRSSKAIIVFTAVVDTIIAQLRSQLKSLVITDPITSVRSQLGLIGETLDGKIVGPWSVQDQRSQLYGAPMTAKAVERLVG